MPNANINIRLTSNAQEVIFRLEKFPEQMGTPIAKAMDTANQLSLGTAERERLSFPKTGPTTPEGLRHITGDLVRGGKAEPAKVSGLVVSSAIYNPIPYAAVHEFGFQGPVSIPPHSRKSRITRPTFDTLGRERKGKKYDNGTHLVRAHTAILNLPARAMYQKSIDKNTAQYTDGISNAITDAWEKS